MPRKERITEAGFYHIINRGVERRDIFLEPEDYDKFLIILDEVFQQCKIKLHSYCLMTNHYHLLIETTQSNISEAMRKLNSKYPMYFNKKYDRTGHLWQGRYASYYLFDDVHFWYVAKYIERNPISANMVNQIEYYPYQSFTQWKHQSKYFDLIKESKILDMTLKEYSEFISSEIQEDILSKIYMTPKYIKENGKMKILYKRIETFFNEDKDINRDDSIKKAYDYGYTKAEIARFLNLSSTTIANKLNRV